MERLRVGVIGCGGVVQTMYLPYLRELDDRFEIAAPCDLSPYLKSVPTTVITERMDGGVYARTEQRVDFQEAFKEELLHSHHCATTGAEPLAGAEEGRADVAQAIAMFKAFRG